MLETTGLNYLTVFKVVKTSFHLNSYNIKMLHAYEMMHQFYQSDHVGIYH